LTTIQIEGGKEMSRRKFVWLLLCFIIIWMALPVSATRLIKQSIEDLAIHSSLVVTGEVKEIHSLWNDAHNQIHTYITIEIESFLRGSHKEESIIVTQLGGVVGDTAMTVIGSPTFSEDEQVLLFLKPEPGTRDKIIVTGLAQGKFHLKTDPVTDEISAENEFEGKLPLSSINNRLRKLFER
jgi:hypothetical protein